MSIKSVFRLAFAGLVAAQVPMLSVQPASAQSTNLQAFECRQDDYYVTVAVRKNGTVSDPMIVWTTEEFSEAGFPPAKRCAEVTSRLNSAIAQNSGTLNGLYLTAGRVNGLPVICSVNNTRAGCNGNNVLFTLKRENNPNTVLEKLFSASGTGTPIQQSGGQNYVDLSKLVNQLF
ncbi:COP23 domain-containing protein [Microcoleus sp. FACHB-672]|uniref:COP23 domain-containing protein n=1 Tax=Microcoleus sp. FACHB-672 TaxID=2692825 RepID=UPI001683822D|nr:COP23 domain-containing protein [Microcoleus sp. FACHB-672]MBD2043745.1 hypothetical protein [Microcoleus sp. FACHB-672]